MEYNPNGVPDSFNDVPDTSKESIELTRNNKGLFAWKIKLKEESLSGATISKLKLLNDKMGVEYGS